MPTINTAKTIEAAGWQAVRHFLKNGIESEEELYFFFKFVWGVEMPKRACCEHHATMWQAVVEDFFSLSPRIAVQLPRGGGKTFGIGACKSAKSIFFPGLRTIVLGAVEKQSHNLFKNVVQFLGSSAPPVIRDYVGPQVLNSEAVFKPHVNRTTGREAQSHLRAVVGTVNGVNSAHADDLVFDERALMSDNIYKEAQGMRTPAQHFPGVTTVISTVKAFGDPMHKLMTSGSGWKRFQACILESVACRETDCTGCKLAVSVSANGARAHSFYDYCQGRLLGQNQPGHISAAGAREKFVGMGLEVAEAQLLCLRPEGDATAFPAWGQHNIQDLDDRVGTELRGTVGRHWILGDFGRSDDSFWGRAYHMGDTIYISHELHGNRRTMSEWLQIMEAQGGWLTPRLLGFIVDTAGNQRTIVSHESAIDIIEQKGHHVLSRKCMDEEDDTDRLRDLVKARRIVVHPRCVRLIEAFNLATNKKLGVAGEALYTRRVHHNKYSHAIAMVRYGVMVLEPSDAPDMPEEYRRSR
jgi:hypothetical protein